MWQKFVRDKNLDEKADFRNRVLEILREIYPDKKFSADPNPEFIVHHDPTFDNAKLGLSNLFAHYLLSSKTNFDLKRLARDHFDKVFTTFAEIEELNSSFEKAKEKIFPQLMPKQFNEQAPMLNFPFSEEVLIGVVLDTPQSYQYLMQTHLESWEKSANEIFDRALENLSQISNNLEIGFVPPPNGLLAINTTDGFDAVRIVLPEMRRFIRETLGGDFFFGIPNRDFLICWRQDEKTAFQQKMRNQIAVDSKERPYTLSGRIFAVGEDNEIKAVQD
ncbi:MAG TPA: DUF1444 family protein [Pyrinomonadaceae bacterium]|nr:DUF1444 family protein [Pyrinomonadaceae bacterium]